VPPEPSTVMGIVMVRTIGVVKLLPLTVKDAVTLEAAKEGVIVIVDAEPVVGVAPVIAQAYVGLVTFCTTAVKTEVAGVITVPAAFLLNPVKPFPLKISNRQILKLLLYNCLYSIQLTN